MSDPVLLLSDAEERLKENGLVYSLIGMGSGGRLLVIERGGRILPFVRGEDGNLLCALWTNPAFGNSQSFVTALRRGEWNLGGERLWIAPEMQYSIRDRKRLVESYKLPHSMDPGSYALSEEAGASGKSTVLRASFELEAHNLAAGTKLLETERRMRSAPNPFRELSSFEGLMQGLSYSGYEHAVTLTDLGSKPGHPSEASSETWTIMQLRQGGNLSLPLYSTPEYAWYYEPTDLGVLRVREGRAELDLAGGIKFKIGFKAPQVTGRACYLMPWPEKGNGSLLLVRNFFCNPSGAYTEEPFTREGDRGYPFHVYNADGSFGCFGELECNGQAIRAGERSVDRMTTWIFTGPEEGILRVRKALLGF